MHRTGAIQGWPLEEASRAFLARTRRLGILPTPLTPRVRSSNNRSTGFGTLTNFRELAVKGNEETGKPKVWSKYRQLPSGRDSYESSPYFDAMYRDVLQARGARREISIDGFLTHCQENVTLRRCVKMTPNFEVDVRILRVQRVTEVFVLLTLNDCCLFVMHCRKFL